MTLAPTPDPSAVTADIAALGPFSAAARPRPQGCAGRRLPTRRAPEETPVSRRPEPRRIVLEGESVVVLTPEEYAGLAQARRQVGGQASRISAMKRDLQTAAALLAEAEAALSAITHRQGECSDGQCLSCRIHALLA
jgi:hypothetical protein